jgi:hypothetical protein
MVNRQWSMVLAVGVVLASGAGGADAPLSREQADAATKRLWDEHVKRLRDERAAEMKERVLSDGKLEMPFFYQRFGEPPKDRAGRSLFISMHGGGGAPKRVNDSQWENQKRLYKPAEGVYVAPRAPTDNWNLWHEAHMDRLFDRLIQDMVVFENVDPNRVYLMGYSAGGDGVYQLAPRMADRWAAAAMMAGHPNETSPLGLRNVPFAIHVGANDGGYKRDQVAAEWSKKLDALRAADPQGYVHLVKLHEGKGHWMDRQDAEALPWMAKYARDPYPRRIVWKQDDVTHKSFYWLALPDDQVKGGTEIVAQREGQRITITTKDVTRVIVRLNDRMLDLDKPVTVLWADREVFNGKLVRAEPILAKTLSERGDRDLMFDAEIEVQAGTKP